MKYRDIEIIANVKKYQQFTVDDNGKPEWFHYEFEGVDVVSYTTDEYPDYDFETIEELKASIDDGLDGLPCLDCGERTKEENGRFYKYEPSIWLCNSCHDERMES